MKILEVGLIQQFSKHTVKAKQKKYPIKNILFSLHTYSFYAIKF